MIPYHKKEKEGFVAFNWSIYLTHLAKRVWKTWEVDGWV